jgi:hypothetical protein
MATKSDIETELTLEVEGELTIAKFIKAATAFLGYVDEVTEAAAGEDARPNWIVQVKKGSNLIGVTPQPGFNPAVIEATYARVKRGIEQIDNIAAIEHEVSESAFRDLKRLAEVVNEDTEVRLWIKKEPVRLSQKVAATIGDFYGAGYKDYGSVEGKLQVVSERGSYRAEITDPLNGGVIKCYLEPELLSIALSLFGKRVEAYGRVRYRADGTLLSIEVEEFVPILPPEKIPSYKDVRGILKEYAL